jgi:hypothetical protein
MKEPEGSRATTEGSKMTTFVLMPATPATKLIADVNAMMVAGELKAYRLRTNGTVRRMSLLPLDSTERETAEYVSDRIDMDGASVQAVARELHVSTAAVRRILLNLELTAEIEAGEWNGIWTAYDSETVEATEEQSPEAKAVADGTVTVELANQIAEDVPGAHCEPEGTTAEELTEALEASLAQTQQAQSGDLHVQLTDNGELAAIPRRTRSHG